MKTKNKKKNGKFLKTGLSHETILDCKNMFFFWFYTFQIRNIRTCVHLFYTKNTFCNRIVNCKAESALAINTSFQPHCTTWLQSVNNWANNMLFPPFLSSFQAKEKTTTKKKLSFRKLLQKKKFLWMNWTNK